MLVLSRKPNEVIRIGNDISLRVISIDGGAVKLGIEAPSHVPVHRAEVYERIQTENKLDEKSPVQLPLLFDVWRSRKNPPPMEQERPEAAGK